MTTVQTATGAVSAELLGRVLMHEHVAIGHPELCATYPDIVGWDRARIAEDATHKLRELRTAGIDTMVDATLVGMGRDVALIAEVAAASGMNIVLTAGVYTFDELPSFLHWVGPGALFDLAEDPLVDMLVRDVEVGIAGTGVRAGILKCVTDAPGLTPGVERAIRAVAQAHLQTGAPITTHTDASTQRGLDQQRLLASEGVDLANVVIGHCGDTVDLDYLLELLSHGSVLGMDRFGVEWMPPTFEERVDTVAALCRRGHADQLVLSHDRHCWSEWMPQGLVDAKFGDQASNWHLTYVTDRVVPALRERGVADRDIDTMLIHAPRRILSGATQAVTR
jgi:phosphotriesterase-related protein